MQVEDTLAAAGDNLKEDFSTLSFPSTATFSSMPTMFPKRRMLRKEKMMRRENLGTTCAL